MIKISHKNKSKSRKRSKENLFISNLIQSSALKPEFKDVLELFNSLTKTEHEILKLIIWADHTFKGNSKEIDQTWLAKKAGCSRETVCRLTTRFQELKLMSKEYRHMKTSTYFLSRWFYSFKNWSILKRMFRFTRYMPLAWILSANGIFYQNVTQENSLFKSNNIKIEKSYCKSTNRDSHMNFWKSKRSNLQNGGFSSYESLENPKKGGSVNMGIYKPFKSKPIMEISEEQHMNTLTPDKLQTMNENLKALGIEGFVPPKPAYVEDNEINRRLYGETFRPKENANINKKLIDVIEEHEVC